ncbi:hypothetical protein ABZS52_30650 [Micromonospora profundi]|uniref:hypothetical protein n=1 Tax=Micromonospora TaxID=1873 RepID=UPI0033BE5104
MSIDWSAWLPAGAAVAAAGVAVWQAVIARGQAATATKSADLAERQARAAEQQVALARQQFQAETEARDDADGPQFEVGPAVWHFSGEQYAQVPVKLLMGKHLGSLVITTPGQPKVRGFVTKIGGGWDGMETAITRTDLAAGATFDLVLMLEYEVVLPLNVLFEFECHEGGGGRRTWHRSYAAQVTEPRVEDVQDRGWRRLRS